MIICHRHRFIFIKTRKTASSSVEIGLSRVCGADDVITTLSEKSGDETLRSEEGGHGPVNWQKRVLEHRGFKEWKRLLLRGQRAQRYAPHTTAVQLRALIEPDIFNGYFKFTLERNPWDRAVSRYYWEKHRWERSGRSRFPGIGDFLERTADEKPHWLTNWDHYADGDQILVDRVLRYENLAEELARLQEDLEIEGDIALPKRRAKGGLRSAREHYSAVLGKREQAVVERVCVREINAFGYRFESP